jgi:hypothetical protein
MPQFETGSGPHPRPATHFEYTVVWWPGGWPGGPEPTYIFKLRHDQSYSLQWNIQPACSGPGAGIVRLTGAQAPKLEAKGQIGHRGSNNRHRK